MNRRQSKVIIRTRGLRRDYRMGEVVTQALRGVDLEVFRGELLSIMGPSGSGKTTLFNAIGALDTPTAGRVFIDEVDVAQLNAYELAYLRCKKIGYIFQQYNLVQVQTCLENVMTPMLFAGTIADEARRRAMRLLGLVGLADRWDHRPKEMSGGQQQRTAIARALANEPSILLCDEPTANLDLATGQAINDLLVQLNREQHVTIICSTHDHRMLNVSDRVLWIRDGRIARLSRREELNIEVGHIAGEGGAT
ncbi:MAG: ABC transporter ATP-binding protein [Phycisphaeraceae bacterium]